jgi:hypothetical protein
MPCRSRPLGGGVSIAAVHAFIYGIATDASVRKITVSRDGGATLVSLDSPHGSDEMVVRKVVQGDRVPLQETKRVFDLDDAIEVQADLDGSGVGEKVRADLEVKALVRKEGVARGLGKRTAVDGKRAYRL